MDALNNVLDRMPKLNINIPPAQRLDAKKFDKKTIIIISSIIFLLIVLVAVLLTTVFKKTEIMPPIKSTSTPAKTQTPIQTPVTTPTQATTPITTCGNGIRDIAEECDRADLGANTCQSLFGTNYEGILSCTPECKIDSAGCTPKRRIGVSTGGGGGGGGGTTTTQPTPPPAPSLPPSNVSIRLSDTVRFSNSVKIK